MQTSNILCFRILLFQADTVQLSRCFGRSRNSQIFLIHSKNVLRVICASLASYSRVTRKFYVIQFASDAQSSFGSSRIAHGSLRDARRDSSHYNIQVYIYIYIIFFFLDSVLRPFQAFSLISRRINR